MSHYRHPDKHQWIPLYLLFYLTTNYLKLLLTDDPILDQTWILDMIFELLIMIAQEVLHHHRALFLLIHEYVVGLLTDVVHLLSEDFLLRVIYLQRDDLLYQTGVAHPHHVNFLQTDVAPHHANTLQIAVAHHHVNFLQTDGDHLPENCLLDAVVHHGVDRRQTVVVHHHHVDQTNVTMIEVVTETEAVLLIAVFQNVVLLNVVPRQIVSHESALFLIVLFQIAGMIAELRLQEYLLTGNTTVCE